MGAVNRSLAVRASSMDLWNRDMLGLSLAAPLPHWTKPGTWRPSRLVSCGQQRRRSRSRLHTRCSSFTPQGLPARLRASCTPTAATRHARVPRPAWQDHCSHSCHATVANRSATHPDHPSPSLTIPHHPSKALVSAWRSRYRRALWPLGPIYGRSGCWRRATRSSACDPPDQTRCWSLPPRGGSPVSRT